MCRYHKDPSKYASMNPQTGKFDLGRYAVALTAMGRYRVEQKKHGWGALFEADGFSPAEIIAAFTNVQLGEDVVQAEDLEVGKPIPTEYKQAYQRYITENVTGGRSEKEIRASYDHNVKILQKALFALDDDLVSVDALGMTDDVTEGGYQHCKKMGRNPRENGPFLDNAVVYLFKNYDDQARSYASQMLKLISARELEALQSDPSVPDDVKAQLRQKVAGEDIEVFEPLRAQTEQLLAIPGIRAAMDQLFIDSVAFIAITAPNDLEKGLGLYGPSSCVMCDSKRQRTPA